MQNIYFWADVETSGTKPTVHQILTLAFVAEDHTGKELARLDLKTLILEGRAIDQGALTVNKIDPYSEAWSKDALTYPELANQVVQFVKNLSVPDCDNLFLAYKAGFDQGFISDLITEPVFKSLFNIVVDPYNMAKKLTKNDQLLTPMKKSTYAGGADYRSSTLQDVATTLHTVCKDGEAHAAMPDVLTLIPTTNILFIMLHGFSFYNQPELLKEYSLSWNPKTKTDKNHQLVLKTISEIKD